MLSSITKYEGRCTQLCMKCMQSYIRECLEKFLFVVFIAQSSLHMLCSHWLQGFLDYRFCFNHHRFNLELMTVTLDTQENQSQCHLQWCSVDRSGYATHLPQLCSLPITSQSLHHLTILRSDAYGFIRTYGNGFIRTSQLHYVMPWAANFYSHYAWHKQLLSSCIHVKIGKQDTRKWNHSFNHCIPSVHQELHTTFCCATLKIVSFPLISVHWTL